MEEKDKKKEVMKILIVRAFPDKLDLNSYNVQEIGLARALTVKGHQCDVVLYNEKEADRQENYLFTQNNCKYSFLIYWLKGYSVFKNGFMPSVKKLIAQYDVIQVHEYDQILSWKLYSRPQKPTVIYHGPYYHPYTKGYNFKCRVFDLLFLKRASYNRIVALTKSRLAADFLKEKGFSHVMPVGVGINSNNFHLASKEKSHVLSTEKKNRLQLLYVGKIEDRRNVYFMVEVFRKALRLHPDIQLSIIGDGEKEYKDPFLKSIEKEIREKTILYRQKATQAELADIYQEADIFLFTSNYEIFGMVLLEAMYFGLPVVSTLNGGSSTLIQNGVNGYVLEAFDVEQWTEKLDVLLKDRDKRLDMGKRAEQTIRTGFTWEHLTDKFENAYQQAIELL